MRLEVDEFISRIKSGEKSQRIESLRAIVESGMDSGKIPSSLRSSPPNDPRYLKINLHIHTGESFGVFQNATEAVLEGYIAGLAYMGINDHYTVAGHREFKEACTIAGIKPLLSMEAIAKSPEEAEKGLRINDPHNPGRCYVSSKGVSKPFIAGNEGTGYLEQMRYATFLRNTQIAEKIGEFLKSQGFEKPFTYDLVLSHTPQGNVTERHLALALCQYLQEEFGTPEGIIRFMRKFWTSFDEKIAHDAVELQSYLREVFIKVGGIAYVEESDEAFLDLRSMLRLHLEIGGIPSYSLIGSPLTEIERDIPFLFDWLEEHNIFAVDVFPEKVDFDRLKSIVDEAKKRYFPVFVGTEHNTKDPEPLVVPLSCKGEFNPYFIASARLLLGHQTISEISGPGFVDHQGNHQFSDRKKAFFLYSKIGLLNFTDKALQALREKIHKTEVLEEVCSEIPGELIYDASMEGIKLDFDEDGQKFPLVC
jgi:hypothetical protein